MSVKRLIDKYVPNDGTNPRRPGASIGRILRESA
jgi:hypothetical protein